MTLQRRAMLSTYRIYLGSECGKDGYPWVWHERLKHEVREDAGNRCIRCGHPYRNGEHGTGEWSPCDERCTHRGPVRWNDNLPGAEAGIKQGWVEGDVLAPVGGMVERDRGRLEYEARWRILTVHHLDGNKANCRWWNLAALCQRCHLQIQGKVQMARVWPWEHSEWFRPYVAGYYASVYLGEDLTRHEVEARMDELLALERAA